MPVDQNGDVNTVENQTEGADASPQQKPRHRMSTRNKALFFLTAWLIVLMPFLFWWNTWFGRPLSDAKLDEYLKDEKHPRHIQHALVQLGERMAKGDAAIPQWYPEVVRLASHPVEEVRNTDAWVMGQATAGPGFHEALLKMLNDPSPMVRGNAALSLVRIGDASGRPQIVALLQPAKVISEHSGKVIDASRAGTVIHQGGLIAKLQEGDQTFDVRSPFTGRLRSLGASVGQPVSQGQEVAVVDPGTEQVWEALRALYLVGQLDNLPAVMAYERELPEIPDHIRQQAKETERAIKERAN
jgi:biotin carboxyl carrier protein